MNNHLNEILIKNYPTLFVSKDMSKPVNFTVACHDGWFPLVETVSKLIVERSSVISAVCVEKKSARLCFIVADCPNEEKDYILGITEMASKISESVCEICSCRGEMFNGNSMAARCTTHSGHLLPFFRRVMSGVNLPFIDESVGYMWREMIARLFFQLEDDYNSNEMSEVVLKRAWVAKGNELCIEYSGGNKVTEGMVAVLLEYSKLVDAETGIIKGLDIYNKDIDYH